MNMVPDWRSEKSRTQRRAHALSGSLDLLNQTLRRVQARLAPLEVNKPMPKAGDYLSEENEHYAQMMRYPVDIYLLF